MRSSHDRFIDEPVQAMGSGTRAHVIDLRASWLREITLTRLATALGPRTPPRQPAVPSRRAPRVSTTTEYALRAVAVAPILGMKRTLCACLSTVMGPWRIDNGWRWFGSVVAASTIGVGAAVATLAGDPVALWVGGPLALLGAYLALETWRWSRRSWSLDERELVETRRESTRRIRWEDVARAEHRALSGVLRVVARDGRSIDVSCAVRDFGLLVMQLERALSQGRLPRLPASVEREPTPAAVRWAMGVGLASVLLALLPLTSDCVRLALGLGGALLAFVGLVLWGSRREHATITVDHGSITVHHRRRTTALPLTALRRWAVGFQMTAPGQGFPVLFLATDDDSWTWNLSPRRWLDVAAALRSAAAHHPNLGWLGDDVERAVAEARAHAASEPAARARARSRWRWALGAVVVATVAVAAALTSAPPADTHLEHAARLADVGLPGWAIGELDAWLAEHPEDLDARRHWVDAYVRTCNDPRRCREGEARREAASLAASGDTQRVAIGQWSAALLEGARGDRARAIEALAAIDPRQVPDAPVDRAELLLEEGRYDEAHRALEVARAGPRAERATRALARVMEADRDAAALARLVDEVGREAVGGDAARSLAAHTLDVPRWAAAMTSGVRAPLLALALLLGLASVALARFWAGARAPSWTRSLLAAGVGAALFALELFVGDALRLARGPIGGTLGHIALVVAGRVALPVVLALAWERASARSAEPLRLMSRAGLVSAGVGAAWALHALSVHSAPSAELLRVITLLPLVTLIAPWAVLAMVDLRQRGWHPVTATAVALTLAGLVPAGGLLLRTLAPSWAGLPTLGGLVGIAVTLQPLLRNAAALDASRPAHRSVLRPALWFVGAVLLLSFVGLTRTIPAGPALAVWLMGALALAFFAVPSLSACVVAPFPAWRRDWWRQRPID